MPWTNSPAERRASAETYGPEYRASRAIARRRARGRCEQCGRTAPLECDHIIPRSQGGSHHHTNLRMLCVTCHDRKTASEGGGNRPGTPPDPEPTTRTAW